MCRQAFFTGVFQKYMELAYIAQKIMQASC